ncbi:uncharacterized protein DS421_11g334900 [Arachis hypogaea]|nr:uncharacterized protein DS421_11g334900 [Arachis hypogaea]
MFPFFFPSNPHAATVADRRSGEERRGDDGWGLTAAAVQLNAATPYPEKKERRRVGAAGPHRHRRVVPPHSTPCRHRCTPKGERERDTESASRREGLAASSIVLTALPPSSSQPWREHSAAVSPYQKRARDQERNVESATHREALAAAVARRRVLSLLFEQSSSPPFYCSGLPPPLLEIRPI